LLCRIIFKITRLMPQTSAGTMTVKVIEKENFPFIFPTDKVMAQKICTIKFLGPLGGSQ